MQRVGTSVLLFFLSSYAIANLNQFADLGSGGCGSLFDNRFVFTQRLSSDAAIIYEYIRAFRLDEGPSLEPDGGPGWRTSDIEGHPEATARNALLDFSRNKTKANDRVVIAHILIAIILSDDFPAAEKAHRWLMWFSSHSIEMLEGLSFTLQGLHDHLTVRTIERLAHLYFDPHFSESALSGMIQMIPLIRWARARLVAIQSLAMLIDQHPIYLIKMSKHLPELLEAKKQLLAKAGSNDAFAQSAEDLSRFIAGLSQH